MLAGFAAALAGDWFLAVRGASRTSPEFLYGVLAFSLAQILWSFAQGRAARPDVRVFVGAALPLALFSAVRLRPVLPPATGLAICAYSLLTALSLAVALATGRRIYAAGIGLLLVSDLMIGGRLLGAPGCGSLTGPLYGAAELCLVASFILGDREPRRADIARNPLNAAALFGGVSFGAFALAALSWPGGGYNPFMRMLSALGRTMVRGVGWPWCHFLFMAGMFAAVAAVVPVFVCDVRTLPGRRRTAVAWGLAANAAGLATIALIPENVDMFFHNVGCWSATLGGATILFARSRPGRDRVWTCFLGGIAVVFGVVVALHAGKVLRFAPWTPTMQKVVIVSFALWALDCARRVPGGRVRRRSWALLAAMVAFVALRAAAALRPVGLASCPAELAPACSGREMANRESTPPQEEETPRTPRSPREETLRAALAWLDHVTGPLPREEELEWWDIGGSQHGLFARRYHIAFCGYAAAALGELGAEAERAAAGRILRHCIERYLRRDTWAYAMSKSYWGRKPWAPDPCFRENVMYTGHLLQLLALYESFTGDTRYWTEGWDFAWSDAQRVHYTVKRLIDVTVEQMRQGPNGGVTCEPGLMFFPCNNHPHIALAIFKRLGHGDWTPDARRWERWALAHYPRPAFGGGALSLVYHVRSGLMFPRGNGGLDGWSLLWYEPWAEDRSTALALWREAAARIDWAALEPAPPDTPAAEESCRDPAPVPPAVTAAFLAAAARACDDAATAERLERIADRALVRRDGMLWLDIDRECRVGATALRILSLAEDNGFRLRATFAPATP